MLRAQSRVHPTAITQPKGVWSQHHLCFYHGNGKYIVAVPQDLVLACEGGKGRRGGAELRAAASERDCYQ